MPHTSSVSGVGAHFHDMYYFQSSMRRFFDFLRTHERPNDIVWLRTVLTGHENCDDETNPVDPLDNFQEYRERYRTPTRWHDWEQFELFNQYMEWEVIKVGRDKLWPSARIELFDIYWMTVLRRDGHPSKEDCLHYLLPGPPDWWNHLFYSNLKDYKDQWQMQGS